MRYTRHALRRARQRLGLSKRGAYQLLSRARRRWLYAGDGYGGATRWAIQHVAGGRTAFVVFVVCGESVLTVYRIMKTTETPTGSVLIEKDNLRKRVAELEIELHRRMAEIAELQGQLTASEIARAKAEAQLEEQ